MVAVQLKPHTINYSVIFARSGYSGQVKPIDGSALSFCDGTTWKAGERHRPRACILEATLVKSPVAQAHCKAIEKKMPSVMDG